MSKWGGYIKVAGIGGMLMLASGLAQAIEPYQQNYKVYWYGIPVGEAAISLTMLEDARYQFQMRVRDHVPLYELNGDSSAIFRIEEGRLIPELAWQKGSTEGDKYDVKYQYADGQLARIDGLGKGVSIQPPLIDYITFVAKLAFDFSTDNGIQDYTVVNEKGKISQHRFAIRGNSDSGGTSVHHVSELDSRDRTEMEVVANSALIRQFTKYRKDKKKLEFLPE
jgi:hypothetical protein